jgi:8-oxo-dGTP pyrophosphatase MutT (NUDIX family)
MYNHAPENYICPFCLVVQGIENEHVFPRYENDNLYSSKRENVPINERKIYASKLREYFQQCPYIGEKKKPFQLFGASVIIYKDGKVLLQQRRDNKCWGYPGGRVELGEVVEDAAKRELFEEAGLIANSLKLFGVFSGSDLHHIYPDGNEVYIIDTVYICDDFSGTESLQAEECLDLQWFDFDNLPSNLSPPIIPALRKFIEERLIIRNRETQ